MFRIEGKYTTADIMIDNLEQECISQVYRMCNNKSFINPIVIMPDGHAGKGSCVGFTMKMTDEIIPNIIGVDIGCGMLSVNLGKIKLNHEYTDKIIRETIPMGHNYYDINDYVYKENKNTCKKLLNKYYKIDSNISKNKYNEILDNMSTRLGTLGGGNHFIEFCESEKNGDIWLTIHTGSRNIGKKVCEFWQDIASKSNVVDVKDYLNNVIKVKYPKSEWEKEYKKYKDSVNNAIKSDFDSLKEEKYINGYIHDMKMCQEYATKNRHIILNRILDDLGIYTIFDMYETIHNYIDFNDNIIRKGAVRSYKDEMFVLPMNMAYGVLLCEGKSNPDWNYSAPHGAGRIYSRSKAKEVLSMDDFALDMVGVYSTSVCERTIDESPGAYKKPDEIIKLIEPTATVIDRLVPTHNIKSNS